MLRERANAQARQLAAYAAEHCAMLERRFTTGSICGWQRTRRSIRQDRPAP